MRRWRPLEPPISPGLGSVIARGLLPAGFRFKISALPGGGQMTQTQSEELKHVVLRKLPAARIVEQFPRFTADVKEQR